MPSTARFPCTALLIAFLVAVACSDGPTAPDSSVRTLAFTSQPTADWATKPLTGVTVSVQASNGAILTSYDRDVILTLNGGTAGARLTGTRTVPAVHGVATFSDVAVDRAGTGYRLTASADGASSGTSQSFDVRPTPRLVFTAVPSSYRIDQPLAPAVQVTAEDSTGTTVTNFNGVVSLAIDGVSLSGSPSVTAANGVARFTAVGIPQEGSGLILRATSPYVTAGASRPLTSQPTLSITTPPGAVRSGVPITTGIEVALRDAGSMIATDFNGPVTLMISSTVPGMALGGTATVNAVSGVATFTGLTFSRPGTASLLPTSDDYAAKSREIRVDCFERCWLSRSAAPGTQNYPGLASLGDKLYLVGGVDDNYDPMPDVTEYDPATDAWMPRASMHAGHYWTRVVALDGRLYTIGTDVDETYSTLEIYDPATDTWTAGASMPDDRRYFGVAAVGGHIYVVGGIHEGGGVSRDLATTLVYDPATNMWNEGPAMNIARSSLVATAAGGRVVVTGGWADVGGISLQSVELLDPATGVWAMGPALPETDAQAIAAVGDEVYVALSAKEMQSRVYRLDVANQSWQQVDPLQGMEPYETIQLATTGTGLFALNASQLWSYAPLP